MDQDSGRKTRPIGVAAAVLLALVAGVWAGVGTARWAATASGVLTETVLEQEDLHRLGMRALVLDVSHSDFLTSLNQGPLRVTEDEVTRIMETTYGPEDTAQKAAEVHGSLLEFFESYEEGRVFRISIADERPALADSLGRILLQEYSALPDCGVGDDLSTLLSAGELKLFGGSGEEFFNEDHPDCRPPDMVASRVEEGLREEVRTMSESGPDSIDAFPDDPGDPGFSALAARVNRVLGWTAFGWPVLLFAGALGLQALVAPVRRLWMPFGGLGAGLVAYGGVALLLIPPRLEGAFAGAGTIGEASEVWASLGIYATERVARASGGWSLLCGAVLLVLVVGIAVGARIFERSSGVDGDPAS